MKLTFENVSAAYRKKTVLSGVSFEAAEGGITALIGRNGAGKSTLINCLTGEKRGYGGRILLDGRDARSFSPRELSHSLACLPQSIPAPHVTLGELVRFGRTPHIPLSGKLAADDEAAAARAIAAVGLSGREREYIDNLSGGERKKAFFAMTLAQETPLAVLDEPTAHLDAASRFEFMRLIRSLCGERTFLVVMHEIADVLCLADRIAVLAEGRIVFCGGAEECLAEGVPQRYFGVRVTGSRENGYAVTSV